MKLNPTTAGDCSSIKLSSDKPRQPVLNSSLNSYRYLDVEVKFVGSAVGKADRVRTIGIVSPIWIWANDKGFFT